MSKVLIVGAGLAGAVCANQLSSHGAYDVTVIDQRSHVGGNCHTSRDENTLVMEHVYGPHIFNTSIPRVWEFVNKHGEWVPYINRVKAQSDTGIYSMPINLHTINQFFGKTFSPLEAKRFVTKTLSQSRYADAQNFEEQAKFLIGEELYKEFFYHYTKRQWGCEPTSLPASILKRLPVRFDYNDNYYNSTWQALPRHGYTKFTTDLLAGAKVELDTPYSHSLRSLYDFVIFTGPIDAFYNHEFGRLAYRTVYWSKSFMLCDDSNSLQGTAVINNCSSSGAHTRSHEHKYFTPWEKHHGTILLTEFSKETSPTDIPFYPKRLPADMEKLSKYQELASQDPRVHFCGRLGTYSYMNMDLVIDQALTLSQKIISAS